MKQDYFPDEKNEKSFGFKVILTLVALMALSIAAIRIYSISTIDVMPDPTLYKEPIWYNYVVIFLCLLSLVGLWYTYNFKKWGVYLTAGSLFTIVVLNPEFSLLRTLPPLFTLFIFVGYGLFEIIPKWKFFN